VSRSFVKLTSCSYFSSGLSTQTEHPQNYRSYFISNKLLLSYHYIHLIVRVCSMVFHLSTPVFWAYTPLCLHLRPIQILAVLYIKPKPKPPFFPKTDRSQTDHEKCRTVTTPTRLHLFSCRLKKPFHQVETQQPCCQCMRPDTQLLLASLFFTLSEAGLSEVADMSSN